MEKRIVSLALTLLAMAFATASVFAYYPFQLTVSPVEPPIVFLEGNNSGQNDLGKKTDGSSNTIEVNIGASGTSVTITIHPTYQTTYYKNVTCIYNKDSKAYNVFLIRAGVDNSLPSGSNVTIIVFQKGATRNLPGSYEWPGLPNNCIKTITITEINNDDPQYIRELGVGGVWEIDIMVYIPAGGSPLSSATFKMHIVYTPSGETPP